MFGSTMRADEILDKAKSKQDRIDLFRRHGYMCKICHKLLAVEAKCPLHGHVKILRVIEVES